jgi:hypothetical protein
MSTYTGSELATKYAAYLIYKGTATPTEINQMTSPKLGYVFDVTANGTINNGNITVVAGDAIVYLAQGWTHMNNGSADQQIAALSAQVTQLINLIGDTDFSRFALKTEIPTVPTKVSAFQNDSGYLTQHQSLAAYQTKADSDAAYVGKLDSLDTTAADGTIVQYTGATTATLTKGHFYIYETGTGWSEINLGNGEGDGIKQKNTLSTAGTEGEIVFYTGTTTEDYTTNNFYKYSDGEWVWIDLPSLTFAYDSTTKKLFIEYGEATKEVNINNIIKDNTDDELNATSENPIQNKVVAEALSDIEEVTDKLTTDLSGLHMEFDTDNLQLVLLDSDDQVIGTANLSTLAKDAMLEDVEIFTEAESGVSVSTPYLKFTFNTDAGTQPIRVPLTDFVINVTTDTVLSPVSTNPVQNKVIYEAIQALQTAINNITGTPDAALSPTSIKPVQNRVITNELNGVKDRVAALEGSGVSYKYLKQVSDLDNYDAENREIVQNIGRSYEKGHIFQFAKKNYIHKMTTDLSAPLNEFYDCQSLARGYEVNNNYTYIYNYPPTTNSVIIWKGIMYLINKVDETTNYYTAYYNDTYINIPKNTGLMAPVSSYIYETINGIRIIRGQTQIYLLDKKELYECNYTISSESGYLNQKIDVLPTTELDNEISKLKYPTWTDESGIYSDVPEAADLIHSGQTLSAILARIKKIEASLKKVAFSGSFFDLSDRVIGGRNLLQKLQNFYNSSLNQNARLTLTTTEYITITATATGVFNQITLLISNFPSDVTTNLIVSWQKCTSSNNNNAPRIMILEDGLTFKPIKSSTDANTGYTAIYCQQCNLLGNKSYGLLLRIDQNKSATIGDTLTIEGLKIQAVSQGFEWTPAPEDLTNN